MFAVREWQKGSFISITLMFLTSLTAHAELVVNINARNNHYSNPIVLHLNAGTYDVVPIGIVDGGLWDAWSTYYSQAGSWKSGYAISSAETGEMYIPSQASGPYYATPQLALEAAPSTSFELTQAADVTFFIWDGSDGSNTAYDNGGGMSLSIIPETASLGLLGLSDFSIDTAGEVRVAATNTTSITRYALQSSTNLSFWDDAQFRLARTNIQPFEVPLPTNAESMFFRVAEDPFSSDLFETGDKGKVFELNVRNPLVGSEYWMKADLDHVGGGTGILSSVEWSLAFPPPLSGTNISSISSDGSISDLFFDVVQLSLDANLMIAVAGTNYTGYNHAAMDIIPNVGGSGFTTADLEGQWRFFELTAQDSPGDWAGWMTSELTFDSSGAGVWSSIQRSDGDTSNPGPVAFSVFDDGSVLVDPSWPTWQMSLDKNLIVFVLDEPDGGISLGVMVRAGASGFSTADLEGRWEQFVLTAADDPADWVGWVNAEIDFASSGTGTWVSVQRSNGDSSAPSPITFTVADGGDVTGGSSGPAWQMSLDKDLIVFVGDDGGGGVSLGLMLRN